MVRPKKSLGQNFLVDSHIIGRMIDACHLSKDETVIEIGPGTGAITREIACRVKKLVAVETDRSLVDRLQTEFTQNQIQLIHADFLKVDLFQLHSGEQWKVVGNLPYYISTPIITKILEHRQLFCEFYLTVQQEFAQRLVASPGGKDYGSFSCFVQYYADVQILFNIKRSCFKPVPKVDSCFVKLTMRQKPLWQVQDEVFLFKMIRLGFQQRRKTLINALSASFAKSDVGDALASAGLSPQIRAEQVTLEQFINLSHVLLKRSP